MGGGDEEEVAALRTALKTSEGKLIEAAEHAENVKWLRAALQKAEKAAAAADEKIQQLTEELTKAKAVAAKDSSEDQQLTQRKLQQLRIQVADGETRAASHFVILQQHQQRKEIQEKKAAALQNRLEQLQADSEATLAALQQEAEAKFEAASQDAAAKIAALKRQAANERARFEEASSRMEDVISQLQEANEKLAEGSAESRSKVERLTSELEACREELQEVNRVRSRMLVQLAQVGDQAEFDAGRCKRLESEVATLTKHLQSTNEDLLQTQKVVEVLEVATAAAIGPRPRLSATSMPTAFRTGGASKALTAAPSAKTTWTAEEDDFISTPSTPDQTASAHPRRSSSAKTYTLPKIQSRKPSLAIISEIGSQEGGGGATAKATNKEKEQAWSVGRLSKNPSFAVAKPKGLTSSRGALAAEISNAGKLLQQLSSRLEAAGVVSQPGSRRASTMVEGETFLVKAIHGR